MKFSCKDCAKLVEVEAVRCSECSSGGEKLPRVLHTGEGRVLLGLTVPQLQGLLDGHMSIATRHLLTQALELLDYSGR